MMKEMIPEIEQEGISNSMLKNHMSDCLGKGVREDRVDAVRNCIMSRGFGVMKMERHLPRILRNR